MSVAALLARCVIKKYTGTSLSTQMNDLRPVSPQQQPTHNKQRSAQQCLLFSVVVLLPTYQYSVTALLLRREYFFYSATTS